jgi:hypothetical protein
MTSQDQAKYPEQSRSGANQAPPLNEQYSAHNPKGIKSEVLTGLQIQAMQKQIADQMAGIVKDIALRKHALGEAVKVMQAASVGIIPADKVLDLAKQMHDFLTEETSQTS